MAAQQRQPSPRPGFPVGLRLGSLFGAPIYVAPSWLIFLGWVTIAFAPLVEDNVAGLGSPRYAVSPAFGLFLRLSVLAHQRRHAPTAPPFHAPGRRARVSSLGTATPRASRASRAAAALIASNSSSRKCRESFGRCAPKVFVSISSAPARI